MLAATVVLAPALSRGAERMVGVVPSGDTVTLLKQFQVPAGTAIVGAEFTSNDPSTAFPEVTLISSVLHGTGPGKVEASVMNARETRSGVVQVFWPTPVAAVHGVDYFVGVRFPLTLRKEGMGIGPAIGATDVPEPNGSYIASEQASPLQPIRVDLHIRLLIGGVGKASASGDPAESTHAEREADPFFLSVESPFSPNDPAKITFGVNRSGKVTLDVYNVAGRRVRRLVQSNMPVGLHHAAWDGRDARGNMVALGIYLVRLETTGQSLAHKLVMVR
jgi:hypothetical protein